jgi:tetratricopeptide (TPR) repeat protein
MLHRAQPVLQQLVQEHPTESSEYREELARYHITLASLCRKAGRLDEAERIHQEALELWQSLAKAHPKVRDFPVLVGRTLGSRGNVERDSGQPEAALPWYAQAISTLQPVLQQDEKDANARYELSQTFAGRALALSALKRHAEASANWDRALELADERNREQFRGERALTWARLGRHARATVEANDLAQQPKVTGDLLYLAARVHAVASVSANEDSALSRGEQETLTERYAARAVGLLSRTQEQGYFKDPVKHDDLERNADFASLRTRVDFQKLAAPN